MSIFQKVTQFSRGNNALDAHSSHSEGFLREIRIFLKLAKYSFGIKESHLYLESYDWLKYSFEKLTQFSHRNKVFDAGSF
jgi:hypothetical protein